MSDFVENKYKVLDDDTKMVGEKVLYRIVALKDIKNYVKKGDLGGYIQDFSNLSQKGSCWVYDNSCVYDNAMIINNAQVKDNSEVFGDAVIEDNAKVLEHSKVYGDAILSDYSTIYQSKIYGFANLMDKSLVNGCEVYDHAMLYGYAHVSKGAKIHGFAKIHGDAHVRGMVEIRDYAKITGHIECDEVTKICGHTYIDEDAVFGKFAFVDSNSSYMHFSGIGSMNLDITVYMTNRDQINLFVDDHEDMIIDEHGIWSTNKYVKGLNKSHIFNIDQFEKFINERKNENDRKILKCVLDLSKLNMEREMF